MKPSRLHDLHPGFEEENPLVEFLLGLHALASPRASLEAPRAREARLDEAPPSEDGFMDFVLGLLALSARLERLLEAETRPPSPQESPPARTTPSALRDLLR